MGTDVSKLPAALIYRVEEFTPKLKISSNYTSPDSIRSLSHSYTAHDMMRMMRMMADMNILTYKYVSGHYLSFCFYIKHCLALSIGPN
jgi:hypothetical protein